MRQTYIVSYDICDPRRLRGVFKTLRGWGDHLQLSVFQCELSPKELVELQTALADIIQHEEDQVLFIDVGPVEGRGSKSINAVGRPHTHPERHAIVV